MKNFLFALLILAVAPSLVFAGGGTKGATSAIEFTNDGSLRLGVIVDAPAGFDPKKATLAEFRNAGGKFLDAGESVTYKVKSGKHQIGAAYLVGNVVGKNTTRSVQVPKNKTVTVSVTGDNTNAVLVVAGEVSTTTN